MSVVLTVLVTNPSPSLTDRLNGLANAPVVQRPRCSVLLLLLELEKTDADAGKALLAAIDNASVPAGMISDTLAGSGHRIPEQTIRRHRKRQRTGGCLCPRT